LEQRESLVEPFILVWMEKGILSLLFLAI
jgi:hypothetical protein